VHASWLVDACKQCAQIGRTEGWLQQWRTCQTALPWPMSSDCACWSSSLGGLVSRSTNGIYVAIFLAMPQLTTSTCLWIYVMNAVLVQHPIFIILVISTPWLNSTMTPLVHREWEPTSLLLYPHPVVPVGVRAAHTASTMSSLVA